MSEFRISARSEPIIVYNQQKQKMSTILNNRAIRAMERIGDIMIPKNGDFPSFSETGSIEHIDDLVAYAPEEDIKDG